MRKRNQATNEFVQNTCFVAGTKVYTKDGLRPIETIQAGELVEAINEKTGEKSYKKVQQTFIRTADRIFKLIYDQGTIIETTATHPFWIAGRGWVEAQNLEVGFRSIMVDGNAIAIKEIIVRKKAETVYNFAVEDEHNYFVSEAGVLVHNEDYASAISKFFSNAADKVKGVLGLDDKKASFGGKQQEVEKEQQVENGKKKQKQENVNVELNLNLEAKFQKAGYKHTEYGFLPVGEQNSSELRPGDYGTMPDGTVVRGQTGVKFFTDDKGNTVIKNNGQTDYRYDNKDGSTLKITKDKKIITKEEIEQMNKESNQHFKDNKPSIINKPKGKPGKMSTPTPVYGSPNG